QPRARAPAHAADQRVQRHQRHHHRRRPAGRLLLEGDAARRAARRHDPRDAGGHVCDHQRRRRLRRHRPHAPHVQEREGEPLVNQLHLAAVDPSLINAAINLAYLLAAVLFIFGLQMLSQVKTARAGNRVSAVGMLVATVVTFFYLQDGQLVSLVWILLAMLVGTVIGLLLAIKTPMTGMPQMVALLNGFGGLASMLVAVGDYFSKPVTAEEH